MRLKFPVVVIATFALALGLSATVLADTIRLRDGSVIRGQIVGFKDGQFTVLIGGSSTRGRRSRLTLYVEDVESIEFDGAGGVTTASNDSGSMSGGSSVDTTSSGTTNNPRVDNSGTMSTGSTSPNVSSSGGVSDSTSTRRGTPPTSIPDNPASGSTSNTGDTSVSTGASNRAFFPVSLRVRADNSPSGWTSSGIVVRRGQRLRVTATGRVVLAGGQSSTPTGVPRLTDKDKLMRDEATGALIAVIGDDNDDFIYIGTRREFTAQRDGVLFLSVNSGTLAQNSGAYDVKVEAEALSGSARQ